jgi:hypothetical protein
MKTPLEEIDCALSEDEFSKAEDLCNRMLTTLGGDAEQALEAKERMAQIKLRSGEYESANHMLRDLMVAAAERGDRSLEGRCHLSLGTVCLRKGRYRLSEEHYRASWHIFRWEVEDKKWLARCYANLGILDKTRGAWEEALKNLELGADAARASGDDANTSVVLLTKCILMRKMGLQDAWQMCEKGRKLAEPGGNSLLRCDYFLESANISLLRHDIDSARGFLRKALSLALGRGYRREQAIGAEIEGDIAYEQGDLPTSRAAYTKALDIALRLADQSDLIPEVSRRLALVELDSGHVGRALEYADSAAGVSRKIGERWELGVSLRVLAQVQLAGRQLGLAAEVLEESIAILRALSAENYELGIAEDLLARVLLKRGDRGDLARARDHFLRARQIFGYLGWAGHLAEVDRMLGGLERDHGLFPVDGADQSQIRFEQAAGKHSLDVTRYGLITGDERIVADIARWSKTELRVLIEGETGVGKELVARIIHSFSRRREERFVAVDCGALSETLADSELFGHARGAFTGAVKRRKGLIEEADGGTLFLDEVGELSEAVQAKLLRVLETREVRRVGENRPTSVNVRLVSATTKDLLRAVDDGRFRRDLYYRLKGALIRIPALRERRGDIELLLNHFLEKRCKEYGKTLRFDDRAKRMLVDYSWLGNVRELKTVVEGLVASCEDHKTAIQPDAVRMFLVSSSGGTGLSERLREVERAEIGRALRACRGNKSKAAKLLGINRKTLQRKIGTQTYKV